MAHARRDPQDNSLTREPGLGVSRSASCKVTHPSDSLGTSSPSAWPPAQHPLPRLFMPGNQEGECIRLQALSRSPCIQKSTKIGHGFWHSPRISSCCKKNLPPPREHVVEMVWRQASGLGSPGSNRHPAATVVSTGLAVPAEAEEHVQKRDSDAPGSGGCEGLPQRSGVCTERSV